MSDFVHLHLHSQYSLLDGAILLDKLFPRLKELGMDTVALTDHGVMYGALDFYQKAKKAGIKPIIGVEAYLSVHGHKDRTHRGNNHLVLLARTHQGYKNLCRLMTIANLDGFFYHARIDKDLLKQYGDGLIGMSACLQGEVAQYLLAGRYEAAKKAAMEYSSIFGEDGFYLEVQQNGLPEQETVNKGMLELARETGLPLVATNDCHYLYPGGAKAHDILLCISTKKTLQDKDRLTTESDQFYLKSPQEMISQFEGFPHAVENTLKIAESCNVEIPLGKVFLPKYDVPNEYSLESFLEERAREGFEKRLGRLNQNDREVYRKRLEEELEVITKMGFAGYFLIVWDFIKYAKEHGVPVGPGRGSGAGSLVAYCMGITDIDPLKYGLLFERFLNPERVNMPDFDIDFCMNRRDEVIKYVKQKYGENNVAGIVTFNSLKARGCIRDVGRVMGMPYGEVDKLAKLVPEGPKVTISSALETEPRLKEKMRKDPRVRDLFQTAVSLEGLNRNSGMHAAGIVIGDKPLWEYCPLAKQDREVVTQYAKEDVEKVGLVKFDFLGLKTLTVIAEAERLINMSLPGNEKFSINDIPLDDKRVYDLISSGDTTGVFQLESSGFKDLMQRLKPDRFEDIIAAVALYRPGPLQSGMVNDFVDRKHGRAEVKYPHPMLEDILSETYGTIVYQEQVMQIARTMSGYTLGGADMLRRAMGKKKMKVMTQQRETFIKGALERNVDKKKAGEIFDLLEKFAEYGFNKSHSAAYALLSYQTAYLKTHYPLEFLAALFTCDMDNTDKVTRYMANARENGNPVHPPHVNESEYNFGVRNNAVIFGLGAIKGVGGGPVEALLEARREGGAFTDIFDLTERCESRKVPKKAIECLIKAGALDGLGPNRACMMTSLDSAIESGQVKQREILWGQGNLFGGGNDGDIHLERKFPDVEEWSDKLKLANEKEVLGFYLSGHPLKGLENEIKMYTTHNCSKALEETSRATVRIGGIVENYRERPAKNGLGRNAFFFLEDLTGRIEVLVFSNVYVQYGKVLESDDPLVVTGRILLEGSSENPIRKIRAEKLESLEQARKEKVSGVEFVLPAEKARTEQLVKLRDLLKTYNGKLSTFVRMRESGSWEILFKLPEEFRVDPVEALLSAADRIFDDRVCRLRFG
ncbi:MAG: DNA polymerase III subunit alpha [Deltaproteobacteria bacterium]|nr:DNA polymerase III subunit alpha [Deltaproteobacteria bacterium]